MTRTFLFFKWQELTNQLWSKWMFSLWMCVIWNIIHEFVGYEFKYKEMYTLDDNDGLRLISLSHSVWISCSSVLYTKCTIYVLLSHNVRGFRNGYKLEIYQRCSSVSCLIQIKFDPT